MRIIKSYLFFLFAITFAFVPLGHAATGPVDGTSDYILSYERTLNDSDVVFVPTATDMGKVAELSTGQKPGDMVIPEDGVIELTAEIAPGEEEQDALPLSFCLQVDGDCSDLLVWNTEAQAYRDILEVGVRTDVPTSVHLSLLIPVEVLNAISGSVAGDPQSFTVNSWSPGSVDEDGSNLLVKLTSIDIVAVTEREKSGDNKCTSPSRSYDNHYFGAYFAGSICGRMYSTSGSVSSMLSSDLKIIGHRFNFIYASASANVYTSGPTYSNYDLRLKFLGYTLYHPYGNLEPFPI